MPRHVSIQPGRLYPQPDYSVAVDREGKWTATQAFLCQDCSPTKETSKLVNLGATCSKIFLFL
jgi:hypothetical protein